MSAPENSRKPPAYQEYASDVLSNLQWRMMSFAERGLWDTIRKECWVNGQVPADPEQLSLLLNKPFEEISQCLSTKVLIFFESQGGYLTCPELEGYRRQLSQRKDRMIAGGRAGGAKTQQRVKEARASLQGTPQASLEPLSRDELNRGDVSQKEMSAGGGFSADHQEWIEAYDGESGEHQYKPYKHSMPRRY